VVFKLNSISKSYGKTGNKANPSDLTRMFGGISDYNHGNPSDLKAAHYLSFI